MSEPEARGPEIIAAALLVYDVMLLDRILAGCCELSAKSTEPSVVND